MKIILARLAIAFLSIVSAAILVSSMISRGGYVKKEDCGYYDFYIDALVDQKNLGVEILLSKGCLPTFVQGGMYQPSIGDSPRSYFTYVSREKKYIEVDHVTDTGRRTVWLGDWIYKVRDWNVKDGEIYTFSDHEVGRLVPCDGFENPIPPEF